ncbi:hypothetical protein HMI54_015038 [Coelomomyces lativittatus]|nr:hypothetical protein HMI56_004386 [Coelomomyces lativittatus]KAJ1513401.1 hypothetical protein HMI54_015038 [Coelomomyces lativittatus]
METNELTQPAAKLMNWCRELATMPAEEFMFQYNSLSNTVKKHIFTIPAIKNQHTSCTFPWSGFTRSIIQECSPPITQAVPSSSGHIMPDLPHPDTNELDTAMPIENNQKEDEQQTEIVLNRRQRRYTSDSDVSYEAPRITNRRRQSTENQVIEYEDVKRLNFRRGA